MFVLMMRILRFREINLNSNLQLSSSRVDRGFS